MDKRPTSNVALSTSRALKAPARIATAYHEAGHAVMAFYLEVGVGDGGASIARDAETHGRVHIRCNLNGDPAVDRSEVLRGELENQAIVSLAGAIAQRKFRPSSVRTYHAEGDRNSAADCVAHLVSSNREWSAYLNWLQIRAEDIIASPHVWSMVEAVANALVEKTSLSSPHVEEIRRLAQCRSGGD